ncbi:MAG TPA: multiheme c-type cytochrome, partial [Dehalococcoidia bacterium]|nr:multiheme c-type cytochrome [Dehalococcoidia bacterium]
MPAGSYSVTFGKDPADGFEPLTIPTVNVAIDLTTTLDVSVVQTNPLVVSAGPQQFQVGFGRVVTLSGSVTGAPAGATPTYRWEQTSGLPVTLTGATTASPTFTTHKAMDVFTAGAIDLPLPLRHEVMGLATQDVRAFSYTFRLTVEAAGFTRTATVTIETVPWSTGNHVVPLNMRAMLGAPQQAAYNWTIAGKPSGSNAALDYPNDRLVTFIPDVAGTYTITESGGAATVTKTIVAAEYRGVEQNCKGCHEDIYTEWKRSKHSSLFTRGVSGTASDHYGESCVSCHSLGYYKGAANSGFDDVQKADSWVFPSTANQSPEAWASMPLSLQNLANIQCENCHGPGSLHMSNKERIAKPFSAAACNQCHLAMSHHDRGMLWRKSAHANDELAIDEGTSAHCGRCHGTQGFVAWVKQMRTRGDSGNIKKPDGSAADTAYLESIGMKASTVTAPSCQACHEPHTTELRIEENTIGALPAGFEARDVGKGALCMTCHNTRNGLRDDAHPPTSYSAPHRPSQADMLMGKNAFFLSGYNISKHAAIKDTCVTCHVALKPNPANVGVASIAHTNHTFKATLDICASCHSDMVTGAATKAAVEQGLADVHALAATKLAAKLDALVAAAAGGTAFKVRAWHRDTDQYSSSSSGTSNVNV